MIVWQLLRIDSEWARAVVLYLLWAEALAAAGHDGPPHGAMRPRSVRRVASRRVVRRSVNGRRPRG